MTQYDSMLAMLFKPIRFKQTAILETGTAPVSKGTASSADALKTRTYKLVIMQSLHRNVRGSGEAAQNGCFLVCVSSPGGAKMLSGNQVGA